jgi:hypothetical protein
VEGTTGEDADTLASELDEFLQDVNKAYEEARRKALKGVKVRIISPSIFTKWCSVKKKKGGQVKMEQVMDEDKFEEWEAFVAQHT